MALEVCGSTELFTTDVAATPLRESGLTGGFARDGGRALDGGSVDFAALDMRPVWSGDFALGREPVLGGIIVWAG